MDAEVDAEVVGGAPEVVRGGRRPSTPRRRRRPTSSAPKARRARAPWLVWALCALAALPVLVALGRGLVDGWHPVGAEAAVALRAHDALHGGAGLTGMPTPEQAAPDGSHLDHLGPWTAWLAAAPVALLGPSGLAITVALVNVAALACVVLAGWRRGRLPLALGATGACLLLCWSLGAAVLWSPLSARTPLVPWFAALVLASEVRLGRWRSLPVATLFAAWCLQAQVAYLPMVAVVAIGTAVLGWLDQRHRGPTTRRQATRGRTTSLVATGVIVAVAALPAVVDQLTGSGNLGQAARAAGWPRLGLVHGLGALVSAFGLPPAWLRGAPDPFALVRSPTLLDVVAFAASMAALGWLATRAQRNEDRTAVALIHTALLAALAATALVFWIPAAGALAAIDALALWRPVTLLAWGAGAWAGWQLAQPAIAARLAPKLASRGPRLAVAGVALVAALALVGATVAAPDRGAGYGARVGDAAQQLGAKTVDALRNQQMVQVNAIGAAGNTYLRPAIVEQLERAGIATRTTDAIRELRRDGSTRAPATATIWVVSDPVRTQAPDPGAVLVDQVDLTPGGPLSAAAQRRRQLRDLLDAAGQVQLRGTGRLGLSDALRTYFAGSPVVSPDDRQVPASNVTVDAAVDLARAGLIASPAIPRDLVDQIAADRAGRTESGDDMEAAVYVRFE